MSVDLEQFRLRRFVESLVDAGECEVVEEYVELVDVAQRLDGNPKAVWLRNAGGAELVGNVMGSRRRLALALGTTEADLSGVMQARVSRMVEPIEVNSADAPVHEVLRTGREATLLALPVHLQHTLDGAPYISASIDYAVDERTGWTNVGIRRLMLRGRRDAGVDLVSPSDLRALYEASASAGRPLPVSFTVGTHPIDHLAAVMRLPVDELGIV